MTYASYIKDKYFVLIIRAVAVLTAAIFLVAFKVNAGAVVALAVIFVICTLIADIMDYKRKKDFYEPVLNSLRDLDKKYLLSEMLPGPSFLEGKILSDVLLSCSKSMADQVASYRLLNKEFREYIEMWVHEAKLPVATVELICKNSADLRQDREADPSITKIRTQIKRLDDYIENVLYYARSENAEKDYIIKDVSLQKIFGSVAVKNRDALQMENAEIRASGLDVKVLTDGKWLEFIIGQLMANSLKYMSSERPPVITVTAEKTPEYTVLSYRDNGMGIPEEDLPRIFEKSFTGTNGHKSPSSTGMGLYIVKNLCRRLGHGIKVSSVKDEYTEFKIFFSEDQHLKMS